jgi:hypothetical protein
MHLIDQARDLVAQDLDVDRVHGSLRLRHVVIPEAVRSAAVRNPWPPSVGLDSGLAHCVRAPE